MNLDSHVEWTTDAQRRFWNNWDRANLQDAAIGPEALRRGETALSLLRRCAPHQPRILELGCGNGWLAERLAAFGPVTGIDIADETIEEARRRVPGGTFHAGDAMDVDLPTGAFDVVLTLETFSHVRSQPGFIELIERVLKPRGHLILTTQNRTVYTRSSYVRPPQEGQLRRWVTMRELKGMLSSRFDVLQAFTIQPSGNQGVLRLINSARLNALASRVTPAASLDRWKERLGLGQTLVVLARKRR